jgi:hypothetical protein
MISAAVERCAGIDVGKMFLAVCVMIGPLDGEPRVVKRRVGTTISELEGLGDWLRQEGITHVVMEIHRFLLEAGFQCAGGEGEGLPGQSAGSEKPQGPQNG